MNDEKLTAYLDDQLPAEERAEVEAWLRDHPEVAQRLRWYAADRAWLVEGLRGVLDEPVPERLQRVVWRGGCGWAGGASWGAGRFGAGTWHLAAGIALFVLGGVLGAALVWTLRDDGAPQLAAPTVQGWVQRAAVAHGVYVPEVVHPVEVPAAQDKHLAQWLTKRLGAPVKLFDLTHQGFELVGGRLLPDAAGPSAQLMYQNAAGQRVTLYLRKPDTAAGEAVLFPVSFRYERQGELGLFYWVERSAPRAGTANLGYALVGPLPRDTLLALATRIYQQGREPRLDPLSDGPQ